MSVDMARKWLILSSLVITGLQIIFLIVAPVFGFPLVWPRNLDVLQIVSPVFLGYLGSATNFIFQKPKHEVTVQSDLLGYVVVGPILIYVIVVTGALAAFGYSHRVGAPMGSGMPVDNLTTTLSLALGVLAATTGIISSYLFAAPKSVGG